MMREQGPNRNFLGQSKKPAIPADPSCYSSKVIPIRDTESTHPDLGRVVGDLIDALIAKGYLRVTDLPYRRRAELPYHAAWSAKILRPDNLLSEDDNCISL